MRYNLKKLYFNGVPADKVRTTSPLKSMTDDQWRADGDVVKPKAQGMLVYCFLKPFIFLALVCCMFEFISSYCTPI